jgi:AAA domain
VISAKANRGKTTICMTFAKHYQRSVIARHGDRTPEGNRLIPVVYVTLPDDCRTKCLDLAICEFYAVQLPSPPTKDDLVRAIQRVARLTMTTLFMVDDIHYLNLATREGQAVNDHLKYLANTVAATFVYAGIDCELTGLMTEGFSPSTHSRSQTKSRFTLLDAGSFDDRTPVGRSQWRALLASFETELVLLEARPGDLSKALAPYLYWRTGGVIGTISALLREGAALAIERGVERLSESLLDEIDADADAEGQATRHKRPSPAALAANAPSRPA